jgi:hypothetical protein
MFVYLVKGRHTGNTNYDGLTRWMYSTSQTGCSTRDLLYNGRLELSLPFQYNPHTPLIYFHTLIYFDQVAYCRSI